MKCLTCHGRGYRIVEGEWPRENGYSPWMPGPPTRSRCYVCLGSGQTDKPQWVQDASGRFVEYREEAGLPGNSIPGTVATSGDPE